MRGHSQSIVTADTVDATVPWTASSNTSAWNTTSDPSLYIVTTSGAFEQVGFVAPNGTLPTGAVTTGFTWYGMAAAYETSAGDMEMRFWATTTNETDVWSLMWNTDGDKQTGGFPIALRRNEPVNGSKDTS